MKPKICHFVPNNNISNLEQVHNYNQPYSQIKPSVKIYRTVFIGIGALYLYLSFLLFTKTATLTSHLVFGNGTGVQTILCGFSALAAFYFLGFGYLMKPEYEAAKKTFKKAKSRLQKLHQRKAIQSRIFNFFTFGETYEKSAILKHFYREAFDNLVRFKEKTLNKLHYIAKSEELSIQEREALFDETIVELKKKMRAVIHQFDKSYSL